VKVNGVRVTDKRIDPGDVLSIAKHKYEVHYSPIDLGAVGPPPPEVPGSDVFSKSLLERAGLERRKVIPAKTPSDPEKKERYEITDDSPGQVRFRHHPL
jgi:adenylate cyclase